MIAVIISMIEFIDMILVELMTVSLQVFCYIARILGFVGLIALLGLFGFVVWVLLWVIQGYIIIFGFGYYKLM